MCHDQDNNMKVNVYVKVSRTSLNGNKKEICPLSEKENVTVIYVYASFLYLDHNDDAYKINIQRKQT